jgi:HEPN domain-containing protein
MSVAEPEHFAWFRKAEHNLLSISNNMVADFDQALSSLNADCRELTHLGFVSRYPDEPGGPTEVEARRAVEIATRVRDAVLQRVRK